MSLLHNNLALNYPDWTYETLKKYDIKLSEIDLHDQQLMSKSALEHTCRLYKLGCHVTSEIFETLRMFHIKAALEMIDYTINFYVYWTALGVDFNKCRNLATSWRELHNIDDQFLNRVCRATYHFDDVDLTQHDTAYVARRIRESANSRDVEKFHLDYYEDAYWLFGQAKNPWERGRIRKMFKRLEDKWLKSDSADRRAPFGIIADLYRYDESLIPIVEQLFCLNNSRNNVYELTSYLLLASQRKLSVSDFKFLVLSAMHGYLDESELSNFFVEYGKWLSVH